MAMQAGERNDYEPTSEINTTPLIDVLLVLLIMLIVTLPAQDHGVRIDTPLPCPSCQTEDPPPEPIEITVDFDGSFAWNGAALDMATLDRKLAIEARRPQQAEIRIKPHRSAKYGYVAHVMASAQREGLTRLGVIGGT